MAFVDRRRQPRLRAAGDLGPLRRRGVPRHGAVGLLPRGRRRGEPPHDRERRVGPRPQPLAARAPGDLAAGPDRRRHRCARPRRVRADQPRRVRPRRPRRRHGRDGRRPGRRLPHVVQRVPPAGRQPAGRGRARAGLQRLGLGLRARRPTAACTRSRSCRSTPRCSPAASSIGSPRRASRRWSSGPRSTRRRSSRTTRCKRRSQRTMANAVRQGLGGAEWSPRHFVENAPFRSLWSHIDELGIVACVHPALGITGPRRDLERRVRRARVAAPRRGAHDRGADRAHAGRRPVRDHRVLPRPARGPARRCGSRSRTRARAGCRSRWRSRRPISGCRRSSRWRSCASSPKRSGTVTRSSCRSTAGRSRWRSCPTGSATRRRGDPGTRTTMPPVPTRRSRCSKRTTSTPP